MQNGYRGKDAENRRAIVIEAKKSTSENAMEKDALVFESSYKRWKITA